MLDLGNVIMELSQDVPRSRLICLHLTPDLVACAMQSSEESGQV